MEEREWDFDSKRLAPAYCTVHSLPQDQTHGPGPDFKHTGEVVTFVHETFQNGRTPLGETREDYNGRRHGYRIILEHLSQMPELRKMVDYVGLSTPLSTTYSIGRPRAPFVN